MKRNDFVTRGWRHMLGDFLRSPAGEGLDQTLQGLSNLLAPESLQERYQAVLGDVHFSPPRRALDPALAYPRPPGALSDPDSFEKACTRCGDCVFACPYGAIHTTGPDSGPLLDPNIDACRLCPDFPCISACREGALLPLAANELPSFGRATFIPERCGNHPPLRADRMSERGVARAPFCKECVRACPVPGAIALDRKGQVLVADHCTGCGLCAAACPETPRALEIGW